MNVVIKLKAIATSIKKDATFDIDQIKTISNNLKVLAEQYNAKFIIVPGGTGGHIYINTMRALSGSELQSSGIGAGIVQINAQIWIQSLKAAGSEVCPKVIGSSEDLDKYLPHYSIVVVGPLFHSVSSDSSAAYIAEHVKADMLIFLKDSLVFDTFPPKNIYEKPLQEIHIADLIQKSNQNIISAGQYPLLDPLCCKILERSQIPGLFLLLDKSDFIETVLTGSIPSESTRIIY